MECNIIDITSKIPIALKFKNKTKSLKYATQNKLGIVQFLDLMLQSFLSFFPEDFISDFSFSTDNPETILNSVAGF